MKIAIVKLSAMGDIIHTMVALQFVKKRYPNIIIDWIVDKRFSQVLENNPDIDNIHVLDIKKAKQHKSISMFLRELRKISKFGNYDMVIDAQGLLKSAIVTKLVKAKTTWGFDKNSIRERIASYFYKNKVTISYAENTINRSIAVICTPLKIKPSADELNNKTKFLFHNCEPIKFPQPYVVFVIGSSWENKNYPREGFVAIAQQLKLRCLVAWGDDKEQEKARWMDAQADNISALPKLNLEQLKCVIANAALLIGNDTGPTHMAWALNVPAVVIFGPTPTSLIQQNTINVAIKSKSVVNRYKLDKTDDSIKEIAPQDIVKIAQKLLQT